MNPGERPVVVSACLLGTRCRYDGERRDVPDIIRDLCCRKNTAVCAFCPEMRAWMKAPREKIMLTASGEHILDGTGQVVTERGSNRTAPLLRAVDTVMTDLSRCAPRQFILKEKSPSCGLHNVYIHNRGWSVGRGVWAAALLRTFSGEFMNEHGEIVSRQITAESRLEC